MKDKFYDEIELMISQVMVNLKIVQMKVVAMLVFHREYLEKDFDTPCFFFADLNWTLRSV